MVLSIILLVLGMIILLMGATIFVRGSSGIAGRLKIPSFIVGLTIVSIGTSLPELSINLVSSINDVSDIALGNILGSNIFNILFIIGLTILIIPIRSDKNRMYDSMIMIGIFLLLGVFMFLITPYKISIFEGVILLILTVMYTIDLIIRARDNKEEESKEQFNIWICIFLFIGGLVLVVLGSNLVVDKATIICEKMGLSKRVIALTILAGGTSLPELVTTLCAALRKEYDIAVGNIVGSAIFNILLIIGISSIITPIKFTHSSTIDYVVMCISGGLLILFSYYNKLNRVVGLLFILIYILYIVVII